jgi:hypothetical protein
LSQARGTRSSPRGAAPRCGQSQRSKAKYRWEGDLSQRVQLQHALVALAALPPRGDFLFLFLFYHCSEQRVEALGQVLYQPLGREDHPIPVVNIAMGAARGPNGSLLIARKHGGQVVCGRGDVGLLITGGFVLLIASSLRLGVPPLGHALPVLGARCRVQPTGDAVRVQEGIACHLPAALRRVEL